MSEPKAQAYYNTSGGRTISTHIPDDWWESVGSRVVLERALDKVADAIAERFLADHLQEVLAMLNPEAVANLAVADAAGSIREALHKKLPDKIVEVERRGPGEVWQRGIFGGMKRIR